MEYILISLFGGGTADWNDIAQTKYDWKEILSYAEDMSCGQININDLYFAILSMARNELLDIIEEYVDKANTKEEMILAKQIEKISIDDFDLWANCLDTRINFIGTKEQAEILQDLFETKIDEIDDKIGFTYINMEG